MHIGGMMTQHVARLGYLKFSINIRLWGDSFWVPRKEEKKGILRDETLPKEGEKSAKLREENASPKNLGFHHKAC